MDSLKDLTDFLKTRDNGASFSDLREVFQNEDEIKSFIKIGLENEVIFSTGQRRGMRYYAKGKVPKESTTTQSQPQPKVKDKKKEKKETISETFETDLEINNDINIYLQSDKPIPGQGVFTEVVKFGDDDGKSIRKFLSSGMTVKTYFIEYDKYQKRNVVTQYMEDKMFNKIALRYEERRFVIEKIYVTGEGKKSEVFKNYDEFRELVRSLIL